VPPKDLQQGAANSTSATAAKRAIDRQLSDLRCSLEAADLSSVAAHLSGGLSPDWLGRFRERKLILKAPPSMREAVAGLLRAAAFRLEPKEQAALDEYLKFSLAVDVARRKALQGVHDGLREMPRCSKADLLAAGRVVFDWFMVKLTKGVDVRSVGASVAERERRLHDLNGAANDIALAVARAINECSRIAMIETTVRLSKSQGRRASQVLRKVVRAAGEVNSFEWFFDCVSYGEFSVDEVVNEPRPTFRFHFVDARRYLLRSLAIRRKLVISYTGRRARRYVRGMLEDSQSLVFGKAVSYYLTKIGAPADSGVDLTHAQSVAKALLMAVDAEDDLLFAASRLGPGVAAHYLVAMAMRWYAVAARAVEVNAGAGVRGELASPAIPLAEIADCISAIDGSFIASALENLTSELPARSHFVLLECPFVKDGAHVVRPFLGGELGNWNVAVRAAMIQGGTVGKEVGTIWEEFYAASFADSEWRLVGRGVKLRRDGRILTDVDLILLREDLLLIVQIKALVGSGLTPYDHWKNRQTIEFGCFQGRTAAEYFGKNPDALISICGKRAASGVNYIQPLVLTNLDHLDGWSFDGVPVAGEVTRKAICRGSRVDYFDSNSGEVLHTHHFVRPEDLTTEVILSLLRKPVELEIAAEGAEIEHGVHTVGDLTLLMPEFVTRPDLNGLPAHEPKRTVPGEDGSAV
jgi:hypothetical protein